MSDIFSYVGGPSSSAPAPPAPAAAPPSGGSDIFSYAGGSPTPAAAPVAAPKKSGGGGLFGGLGRFASGALNFVNPLNTPKLVEHIGSAALTEAHNVADLGMGQITGSTPAHLLPQQGEGALSYAARIAPITGGLVAQGQRTGVHVAGGAQGLAGIGQGGQGLLGRGFQHETARQYAADPFGSTLGDVGTAAIAAAPITGGLSAVGDVLAGGAESADVAATLAAADAGVKAGAAVQGLATPEEAAAAAQTAREAAQAAQAAHAAPLARASSALNTASDVTGAIGHAAGRTLAAPFLPIKGALLGGTLPVVGDLPGLVDAARANELGNLSLPHRGGGPLTLNDALANADARQYLSHGPAVQQRIEQDQLLQNGAEANRALAGAGPPGLLARVLGRTQNGDAEMSKALQLRTVLGGPEGAAHALGPVLAAGEHAQPVLDELGARFMSDRQPISVRAATLAAGMGTPEEEARLAQAADIRSGPIAQRGAEMLAGRGMLGGPMNPEQAGFAPLSGRVAEATTQTDQAAQAAEARATALRAAGPSLAPSAEPLAAFGDRLEAQYPGLKLDVSQRPGGPIVVSRIVLPPELRNAGTGTEVMQAIIGRADAEGSGVALSPSADFGGSKARLTKWYSGMGFKSNTGRSADLSVSESMIRPAATTGALARGAATLPPLSDIQAEAIAKTVGIPVEAVRQAEQLRAGGTTAEMTAADQAATQARTLADQTRAQAEANPANAPARFRPAIGIGTAAQQGLEQAATAADKIQAGSGDIIREGAATIPTTLQALTAAGVNPEHLIGSLDDAERQYGAGNTRAATVRLPKVAKLASENVKEAGIVPKDLPSALRPELSRISQVVANESAGPFQDRYGTTAGSVVGDGVAPGRQMASALRAAGYTPWNPAAWTETVAPESVNSATPVLRSSMHDAFKTYWNPTKTGVALTVYDALIRGGKNITIALNPSYHAAVILGNTLKAAMLGGVNPADLAQGFVDAARMLREDPANELAIGASRSNLSAEQADLLTGRTAGKRGITSRLAAPGWKMSGYIQTVQRLGLTLAKINEGASPAEAVGNAARVMGDFGHLGPFEQNFMRRVIPGYDFYKQITTLALRLPIENPERIAWLNYLTNASAAAPNSNQYFLNPLGMLGGLPTLALPIRGALDLTGVKINTQHPTKTRMLSEPTEFSQAGATSGATLPQNVSPLARGRLALPETLHVLGSLLPEGRLYDALRSPNVHRYDTGEPRLSKAGTPGTLPSGATPYPGGKLGGVLYALGLGGSQPAATTPTAAQAKYAKSQAAAAKLYQSRLKTYKGGKAPKSTSTGSIFDQATK